VRASVSNECLKLLTKALQRLAKEAVTKGTDINKLLTERQQR